MTQTASGNVTLLYATSDPYDASIRLLNDAQRFGAQLIDLNYAAENGLLRITLRVPDTINRRNLADRLDRHYAASFVAV